MAAPSSWRIYCFGSLITILIAFLYSRVTVNDILNERLHQVTTGLLEVEIKHAVRPKVSPKVAVGFGACKDLFTDASELLARLNTEIPVTPFHYNVLNNVTELKSTFAYFYQHGAAAERFMSNSTLFSEMIAIGAQLPGAHWALGGNAPVMASRFNLEGCEVLLGTKMSEDLKSYFDPRIKISGGNLASDDIHLILEYKSGDSWGKLTAARANRFIVHSDLNNPTISSLNDFTAELKSFHPQLLVIGGLQMMDNFPFKPGQRREILQKIRNTILDLSCWTRLHFEMASFTDESLLQDLAELVFPYIDSFGMNEQELPNLYAALYKKNISLVSDTYPRVATVLDQMREVFRVVNTRQNQRGCEQHARIHVHTLAYQVIMTRHGSSWKNNLGAAAKASLTANRHTCGSGEIDVAKARLILDNSFASSKHDGGRRIHIDDGKPVSCWREEGVHICVAPVLVCTEVLQTAGGGDTISSAALAYQI